MVSARHVGMTVFFDLQRLRPAFLHRIAKPMQRANPRISTPRKNKLASGTHTNELVINHVGRHADQGQILFTLANNFMPCGMWDQVGETLHGHLVAVMDESVNGLTQCHNVSHDCS